MKGTGCLLLFFFLFFPCCNSRAASDTGLTGTFSEQKLLRKKAIRLPLQACLQLALRNNVEIAIERISPQLNLQKVIQERSVFDPVSFVSLSKDRSVTQTSSAFARPPENEREGIALNAGISKKLTPGTETELLLTNKQEETNSIFAGLNPSYTSELTLSLTQPLLRDFGIGINTSRIRIASNNREISRFQFQDRVIRTLAEVESIYWELVYAMEELKVKQDSLRLAEDFLKITRRRVELGILPRVESLQAEAEKAVREEGVITAEDSLRDTEDRLRKILNLSDEPEYWEIRLIPSDRPKKPHEDTSDLYKHLRAALENRPDLNQARIELENKKIRLKYTRNQLLPRLDLIGTFGLSGLSGTPQPQPDFENPGATVENPFGGKNIDSLRDLKSGDFYSYSIGIRVEYPLGNRSAKSQRVMADLEKQKAIFAVRELENRAIREVREAWRQIHTNRKRIDAAGLARKLAEERLRTATRRFELGLATSHDVLEYQEKLALAKSNELRARIDYQESLVRLDQVKGTLLERIGVTLSTAGHHSTGKS